MHMAQLIAKLRDSRSTMPVFGGRVAGVSDPSRVVEYANLDMPCALVFYVGDAAEPQPPGANTEVIQRITETWGIAVKLRATEDIRAQAPVHTIPAVRDALFGAIFNWAPDPDHDLISYAGCQRVDVNRDVLVWVYTFLTAHTADACHGEQDQFELPEFLRVHARVDFIDPFDPLLPPSVGYDPRYPPPLTTGPDGRIEAEFRIDVPQPPPRAPDPPREDAPP